jgi:poly(A) polymerase
MAEPLIVPRAEHTLSRRDIDPDALKVLYRLNQLDYRAYLVGGSVRDLLLGRPPKDFDVGTDAHPYQVKRAFRNCWIVGRRFRLAHVKFGTKTIEVATFRKSLPPPEPKPEATAAAEEPQVEGAADRLIRRDNSFGTPEEDAFRRDFTINALFYDIATFSIIDYVNGLEDLRARRIRSIGDPMERFEEDPVRMLRAVVLAARLGFEIDQPILDAVARQRALIARAAPPRLLEEFYKILRSGASQSAFESLSALGLLEYLAPELRKGNELNPKVAQALAALDRYRSRFQTAPESLRNPVLLGTLLAFAGPSRRKRAPEGEPPSGPTLGQLPLARRDLERYGQMMSLVRRLEERDLPARAERALVHRAAFPDTLAWLEIHGTDPDLVEHWRRRHHELMAPPTEDEASRPKRRRRRRRRRRKPRPVEGPAQDS